MTGPSRLSGDSWRLSPVMERFSWMRSHCSSALQRGRSRRLRRVIKGAEDGSLEAHSPEVRERKIDFSDFPVFNIVLSKKSDFDLKSINLPALVCSSF